VNPVIALGLAWLMGDGELTGSVLLSAAIVVSAVVLTWTPAGLSSRAERGILPARVRGIPAQDPSLRSG
jgi:hypothetical protein